MRKSWYTKTAKIIKEHSFYLQSYYIFLDYARKILKHLHILHFFYTFEHLPWLYPHTITSPLKPFCSPVRLSPAIGVMSGAHYQSSIQELLHLEATFAKCWTYYSSRAIFSKSLNTLHSIISISLANKLGWLLMTEWDRLYLSFLKILLASLAYVHFL